MSEEYLYGSDICSFFDQCSSETMSQGMWCYFFVNTCIFCIFPNNFFDTVSAEMFAETVSGKANEEVGRGVMSYVVSFF